MKKTRRRYFDFVQYPEIQVSGGTIDITDVKSIYLQIRSHLFADNEHGAEELKIFFWEVKQTISKILKGSICNERFIAELDFSETFKDKPYTYIIMDFTFYPNDKYEKTTYEYFLNEVCKNIYRDNIRLSPFEFYRTKELAKLENKNINCIRTFD